MKRILSCICIIVLILTLNARVSATTDVPDVFGNEYVKYDINADGYFNLCDLVRAKKYLVGASVMVYLASEDKSTNNAELLVLIKQELLKGDLL